jgi:hypothetical protein
MKTKKELIGFISDLKSQCIILYNYLIENNHGTQYEKGQIDLLHLQINDLEENGN